MPSTIMPKDAEPNGDRASVVDTRTWQQKLADLTENEADRLSCALCDFLVADDTKRESASQSVIDAVKAMRAAVPRIVGAVVAADAASTEARVTKSRARRSEAEEREEGARLRRKLRRVETVNARRKQTEKLAQDCQKAGKVQIMETGIKRLEFEVEDINRRQSLLKEQSVRINGACTKFFEALEQLQNAVRNPEKVSSSANEAKSNSTT